MREFRGPKRLLLAGVLLLQALAFAQNTGAPKEIPGGGMKGYIGNSQGSAPAGYGYGISFYTGVWPITSQALDTFQIGLASTWIIPNNDGFAGNDLLCPPGTTAKDGNWDKPSNSFEKYFQTIEGGTGVWGNTYYPMALPKYRIIATAWCYSGGVSTPGWGYPATITNGTVASLPESKMGVVQLSNRLLIPPDGFTFQPGTSGQLLGRAWMALPMTEIKGNYQLQTQAQAAAGQCLQGSPSSTGMAACSTAPASLWQFLSAPGGYAQLQTQEGNCLDSSSSPAVATRSCNSVPGQLWKTYPAAANGFYQIKSQASETANFCLTDSVTMAPCAASANQYWALNGQTTNSTPPVGNLSWTLFLNTASFQGPVAFFIPDMWAAISQVDTTDNSRGLDSRPGTAGGGALEFNTIPFFLATGSDGTNYTRTAPLQFPVDSAGRTLLMQDWKQYSAEALFSPTRNWFGATGAAPSAIDPKTTWTATNCGGGGVGFNQDSGVAGDNTQYSLTGFSAFVKIAVFDAANCAWGLQWTGAQTMTPDGYALLPEYYMQKDSKTRAAIPKSSLPANSPLLSAAFASAAPQLATYVSPSTGTNGWTSPGPVKGPFKATLADGSTVTYSWYRFVDQPVLQHLGLSSAQKTAIQQYAEMVQSAWTGKTLQAPPSSGSLLTLDSALSVTPPAGLEVGYVPIVTQQEMLHPQLNAVVNAATGLTAISSNCWISIYGANLSQTTRGWATADFINGAMPTQLDGVSVTVNGKPAFISYVSPTQVNVLAPVDTATGSVSVRLSNSLGAGSVPASLQKLSPALFTIGNNYVAATHTDGSLIGPASLYPGVTTPAKPGETIVLYGAGFGPVTPAIVNGSATQSGTLPTPLDFVRIGGDANTQILFAGVSAPGLYQFNVVVPPTAQDGDLAIFVRYQNSPTQQGVSITVHH